MRISLHFYFTLHWQPLVKSEMLMQSMYNCKTRIISFHVWTNDLLCGHHLENSVVHLGKTFLFNGIFAGTISIVAAGLENSSRNDMSIIGDQRLWICANNIYTTTMLLIGSVND